MKRMTAALMAAALLILSVSLCACGGSGNDYVYTFVSGSTTLSIGASADTVNALGTPQSVSESASCGGIEGTDRVLVFPGFRVYTTPAASGDVICKIELTDDSVKTPEGLTIGASAADVKAAMGPGTPQGENLVYEGGSMKLTFVIREGVVTNIQYAVK